MIKVAIIFACALLLIMCQDALLAPESPFVLSLNEQATYHQNFLIEIDTQQIKQDWNILYAHQLANARSVVDLEFIIVHKQFPERQGHVMSKCRLEDQSKRWCRFESQGINFNNYLIKVKLNCVTDCKGVISIGFANRKWSGEELPQVLSAPLEEHSVSNPEGEKKFVLFKIIAWMVFTLVLILLAIRFGEKIATIFDRKMEEQRQEGLKEKRIYQKSPQTHVKQE